MRQNTKAKPENMRKFSCKRCPWVERPANCIDRRLLDGAKSSDLKGVKDALADGARLGARDDDRKTAMDLARDGDSAELKNYLQDRVLMESVDTLNGGHLSGKVRRMEMSDLQTQDDARCPEGRLLVAAMERDLEGVKAALKDGADPDARDSEGRDAMALAKGDDPAGYRSPELVNYLRILKLQRKSV